MITLPANRTEQITARPGTYALLLRLTEEGMVFIGRRHLYLTPGWAIYMGSAFGPGGIAGRLRHHRQLAARPHWHIDYLRPHTTLEAVWYSDDPLRRECLWAKAAQMLGGKLPPFRFGASDCRCPSHLSLHELQPSFIAFCNALQASYPEHAAVMLWT